MMKRFPVLLVIFLLAFLTLFPSGPACAETLTVTDGKELIEALETSPFKKGTVLLDSDVALPRNKIEVRTPSVVIDGQLHAIRLMPGTQVSLYNKGPLKLQNITDLGSLNLDGYNNNKVDFDNVVFTGNEYNFVGIQSVLSSVRTDRKSAGPGGKRSIIHLSQVFTKDKARLTLDPNCSIGPDWELSTTNSKLVVDCDYYDARVQAFAGGTATFSGKGTGFGTLYANMNAEGKINIDARTKKIQVSFPHPESKKNQTVTVKGATHNLEVKTYGVMQKNNKLNLQLTDVNEVRFLVLLDNEQRAQPTGEEEEKLRNMIRKSIAHISLKKVKGRDGNPVENVTFEISGRDESKSWKLEWTEALNGK